MNTTLSKFVPWAEKDLEFIAEDVEHFQMRVGILLNRIVAELETPALSDLSERAYELAGCLLASNAAPQEVFNALRLSARAGAYHFDFLLSPKGTEKEIDLGQGTVVTLNNNWNMVGAANVFFWGETFSLCTLCREIEFVNRLAQVPIDVTRKAALKHHEETSYLVPKADQCFWRCEFEKAREYFAQTLEVTNPRRHDSLYFSSLEALITKDSQAFDDALYQMLKNAQASDQQYEDGRRDPKRLLFTGLIAIAAIAHDQGMTFETRSDYMPDFLFQGTFCTEKALLRPPATPDPDLSHLDDLLPTPAVRILRTETLSFDESDDDPALVEELAMAQFQLNELNAGNAGIADTADTVNKAELAAVEADITAIDRRIAQQTAQQMTIQCFYPHPEYEFYLHPTPTDELVYPHIERLWGGVDVIPDPDVFGQIWRVCVNPDEPPTWLILATTFGTYQLRVCYLDDDRTAEEGSRAYLEQGLKLMSASPEASTRELAAQLRDALQQGRINYYHVERELDPETGGIGKASYWIFDIQTTAG